MKENVSGCFFSEHSVYAYFVSVFTHVHTNINCYVHVFKHNAARITGSDFIVIGSRAASFKRPLLSVDVSACLCDVCVCLSANLMLISRKVLIARRLVTSRITSCDSITSYSWRHNIQSRRIRKLGPDQLSV